MSFLSDAKFAASSFLSSLMKDDTGVAKAPLNSPVNISPVLRGEAKRTWAIRKREFDKLRALLQSQALNDAKPKQRFFHTSMLTDLSKKKSTIKKIDDIEAQMSMQWWKTDRLDFNLKDHSPKP